MDNKKEYVERAKLRITNNFRMMMNKEVLRFNKAFPEEKITRLISFYGLNEYIDRTFKMKTRNVYRITLDKLRKVFG